jgi:uncharacterized protein (TIGR03086 family)
VTTYPILVDAERRLVELVESLAPGDLRRPTPCAGWDVRALLSHTLAGIEIFASTVDGLPAPTQEQMFSGTDLIGDDPLGVARRATIRSQRAWADLDEPERKLTTILGVLPAGEMLSISAFATIVHGWDIATATGQAALELPVELLAHASAVSHAYVPDLRAVEDSSLFKPEAPVPANSTATQELMAFLGRTESLPSRPAPAARTHPVTG